MRSNYLTYYELLGIEPNATKEEIFKAYKAKAKEYHPDKNDGHHTANKLFQYILQAKEILTNPQNRLEYDYMAGIKKKPQVAQVSVKGKRINPEALITVGAIGLLVGIFLGSNNDK